MFFWDGTCNGFGLRALASGRRSWVYQYRDEHKRTRRIALGDATAVSLEAAREAARQHAAKVTQGSNPSAERHARAAALSVADVIEEYLKFAEGKQRPKTYKETVRYLRQDAKPLHHERVPVERAVIARWVEKLTTDHGPIAANRARAALSAMWAWGMKTGRIGGEANPVVFTIKQQEMSRERVVTDAEIKAIWAATDGAHDYDRIVRLCLLTGCRREEIGGLRWSEVGNEWITIAAARMKGKLAHEVPLLPMIAAHLPEGPSGTKDAATAVASPPDAVQGVSGGEEQGVDGPCVFGRRRATGGAGFSGWSKCKERLDAKLAEAGHNLPQWGLHDLRRTMSTKMHDAGVAPHVIEALLAHKQAGVAAVYNRASFRQAKREALGKWHELLAALLAG
jgi:integrase